MAYPEFTTEELESEEWRHVQHFDRYQVSNLGRVRRSASGYHTRIGKILTPIPDRRGYLRVNLRNGDGHPYMRFVHRLVALTFLPDKPNSPHVNHIDGVKANNRTANLEHVTHRENMRHAAKIGLSLSHERNPRAKITREQVQTIRASNETVAVLMTRHFLSETQVRRLRAGEQWRGV